MINKWLISFLLIFSMSAQVLSAESKAAYYAQKGAKIGWQGAKIGWRGAQTFFGIFVGMELIVGIVDGSISKMTVAMLTVVAATLLYDGVSGLNDELELKKRIQKLYKKQVKKEIHEDSHDQEIIV